jgi:major membrane immunogen (membrane-anchored lipoprotein)
MKFENIENMKVLNIIIITSVLLITSCGTSNEKGHAHGEGSHTHGQNETDHGHEHADGDHEHHSQETFDVDNDSIVENESHEHGEESGHHHDENEAGHNH